ncbi:hypothetical protein [Alteriqipengyuania sp. 357]
MSEDRKLHAAPEIGDDLLILFPRNTRPTLRQVRAHERIAGLVDALGPDLVHYGHQVDIAPPDGLSLQRAGLGFDLVGLAPGPSVPVPDIGDGDVIDQAARRSVTHASSLRLGPHIAAGRRSLTILREWFRLGNAIATTFGAQGLCWVPGGIAMESAQVAAHLRAWDARADVPVNLLASFRLTLDGALQSHGLAYFTGQEFRIEAPLLQGDEAALARLIFTHLFYAGMQERSVELAAPQGYPLRLEPSGNRRFLRVWPG